MVSLEDDLKKNPENGFWELSNGEKITINPVPLEKEKLNLSNPDETIKYLVSFYHEIQVNNPLIWKDIRSQIIEKNSKEACEEKDGCELPVF
jgi:hypothetical protein